MMDLESLLAVKLAGGGGGGGSKGITMDLLWENASTMSNFFKQQIAVPYADYKFIVITAKQQLNNEGFNTFIFPCQLSPHPSPMNRSWLQSQNSSYNFLREFTYLASGILFELCTYYDNTKPATKNTDGGIQIPLKIYGIK